MCPAPALPNFRAFAPGDLAPRWAFADAAGREVHLTQDSIAGHWVVLCLHPAAWPWTAVDAEQLGATAARLRSLGGRFFVVRAQASDTARGMPAPHVEVLVDRHEAMTTQLGLNPPRPLTIVLRPDAHFAQFFDGALDRQLSAASALVERAVANDRTVEMTLRHPPVLLVPEVFSLGECRMLVDIFETHGQVFLESDSAVDHLGGDYKMRVPEHMREDRIDHFFFDRPIVEFLSHRLNRVVPEIKKAFQYDVTKYESFRVARYEGSRGGYTHGHRDNVEPTTYRRFAMSINLNTDAFEGGELRFPEFGDVRYRPPSGCAIVFSSSLLHEALHVTRGRRYVFLAFMFGAS